VEDALRLDRAVVEIGAAEHGALALLHLGEPGASGLEFAAVEHRLRLLEERFEGEARIGDDAEIGAEDAADLRRLDVDVDELAAAPIDLGAAGVPVGPAIADAEHEIGLQEVGVAVTMTGL
jgi:hypothetical protein